MYTSLRVQREGGERYEATWRDMCLKIRASHEVSTDKSCFFHFCNANACLHSFYNELLPTLWQWSVFDIELSTEFQLFISTSIFNCVTFECFSYAATKWFPPIFGEIFNFSSSEFTIPGVMLIIFRIVFSIASGIGTTSFNFFTTSSLPEYSGLTICRPRGELLLRKY